MKYRLCRCDIYKNNAMKNKKPTITFLEDDDDVNLSPIEVKVRGGKFDEAFREFKLIFQKERILSQIKEKQQYEKPSEKKRRKRKQAHERRLAEESIKKMIHTGEWERKQKRRQIKREQKIMERKDKMSGLSDLEKSSRLYRDTGDE